MEVKEEITNVGICDSVIKTDPPIYTISCVTKNNTQVVEYEAEDEDNDNDWVNGTIGFKSMFDSD